MMRAPSNPARDSFRRTRLTLSLFATASMSADKEDDDDDDSVECGEGTVEVDGNAYPITVRVDLAPAYE